MNRLEEGAVIVLKTYGGGITILLLLFSPLPKQSTLQIINARVMVKKIQCSEWNRDGHLNPQFRTHSYACFYTGSTTEEAVQGGGICIFTAVGEEQGEEGMMFLVAHYTKRPSGV